VEAVIMTAQGRADLHQFGWPRGGVGWLVGHLMALKNGAMNRAALAQLDPRPGERVLEIGYGPGRTLKQVARRLAGGLAAGLDHSEIMARQAARRCRRLIRRGRVEVKCGGVSAIPYPGESFDKAFAVNCFQFWPRPIDDLREVCRVLTPGGRLVLTIRAAERPLRFDLARASGGRAPPQGRAPARGLRRRAQARGEGWMNAPVRITGQGMHTGPKKGVPT
jgi:SAM-dependent methyltransferase